MKNSSDIISTGFWDHFGPIFGGRTWAKTPQTRLNGHQAGNSHVRRGVWAILRGGDHPKCGSARGESALRFAIRSPLLPDLSCFRLLVAWVCLPLCCGVHGVYSKGAHRTPRARRANIRPSPGLWPQLTCQVRGGARSAPMHYSNHGPGAVPHP